MATAFSVVFGRALFAAGRQLLFAGVVTAEATDAPALGAGSARSGVGIGAGSAEGSARVAAAAGGSATAAKEAAGAAKLATVPERDACT